jgi:hypothetical protein
MSEVQRWVIMAFIGMVFGATLILWATAIRTHGGVWIPCEIAEISPDIPLEARNECRRRRKSNGS